MASAPDASDGADLFDQFLADRGHETTESWGFDYRKKQCPECHGLHDLSATSCSVCGWAPVA